MLKTIFLIWSFSFAAPRQQPHRFGIKFYNNSDSCVRTVDESGIQTVKWADQTYTINGRFTFDAFISDQRIRQYLIDQHVDVE